MKQLPPYPVFPGEKYVGLGYKYMLADRVAPLLTMNKVLCLVEYREDGSSRNMVPPIRAQPAGIRLSAEGGNEIPALPASAVHGGGSLRLRLPAGPQSGFFAGITATVADSGGPAVRSGPDGPYSGQKRKKGITEMKIAYVLDDLDAAGGIQAVTRAKAAALAAIPGNEIMLVTANDSRRTASSLPPGVKVVHLGVNYYEDDWKGIPVCAEGHSGPAQEACESSAEGAG